MHTQAYAWVKRVVERSGPGSAVLEIGSRNINGSVRPLFRHAKTYIGIDIEPGPGVDMVAGGESFKCTFAPDRIVSCEVLEHTPHARVIIANAWNQLAPGGWLIVTAAAPERGPHSAIDGTARLRPDEHYAGIAPVVLEQWVRESSAYLRQPADVVEIVHAPEYGDVYLAARKALPQ